MVRSYGGTFPYGRYHPSVFRDLTARSAFGADVVQQRLYNSAKGKEIICIQLHSVSCFCISIRDNLCYLQDVCMPIIIIIYRNAYIASIKN